MRLTPQKNKPEHKKRSLMVEVTQSLSWQFLNGNRAIHLKKSIS